MKKALRKINSMLIIVCMILAYVSFPVNAVPVTGSDSIPNNIYFWDFEDFTSGQRLAQDTNATDWVYRYASTYTTNAVGGSTVVVANGGGTDVYRFPNAVTSGKLYMSMDIGVTNDAASWGPGVGKDYDDTYGDITFYTEDYVANSGDGLHSDTDFTKNGRKFIMGVRGRVNGYDADVDSAYFNVSSPYTSSDAPQGINSLEKIRTTYFNTYLPANNLYRLDVVYDFDTNEYDAFFNDKQFTDTTIEIDKITALGILPGKGMFIDNIKVATMDVNSFDASMETKSATSFELMFTESIYSLTVDNVLVNDTNVTSVTKKNCNTYIVECAQNPDNAYIELVNVTNFMGEAPKTTSFGERPSVTPVVSAEIITKTTNTAPTGIVPMGETLMLNVKGATPVAYQWKYKNSATGTTYNGDTDADFVVPASYIEMTGDCKVWCVVTYEDGSVNTQEVTMDMSYKGVPSWGYDKRYNGNQYGPIGVEANSNPSYTFEVDGKKFVLAKEQNVKDAAYFVVALEPYGDIYLEGKRPSETEGEERGWKEFSLTNGGFVNDGGITMETMLLGAGNDYTQFDDTSDARYALPDVFEPYIDMNHSWPYVTDGYGTVKAFNAGVTLLSFSDYQNFSDRIGYKDDFFAIDGVEYYTLLRDYSVGARAGVHTTASGNVLEDLRDEKKYQVRPCFWLAKDFFEENVIDLSKAGNGVKNIIRDSVYTNQTILESTYRDAGKGDLFDLYLNPNVRLALAVRETGADVSEVKPLDTVVANMEGVNAEFTYIWQSYADDLWVAVPTRNIKDNELAITNDLVGKSIRVTATTSGGTAYSVEFIVPAMEQYTEAPTDNENAKPLNNPENSDSDRIFTVDGRGFVLLEKFDNDVQTYYVTTTDSYGTANNKANGTRLESKNYTYEGKYKNEDNSLEDRLLENGNDYAGLGAATQDKLYKLPDGIKDHIEENVWGRYKFPYWASSVDPVNSIQMLSRTDFMKYEDILGWRDNVFTQDGNEIGGQYYLIRDTAYWVSGTQDWYRNSVLDIGDHSTKYVSDQVSLVRPVFYLSGDFFKNVRIDLESAGDDIIDMMKSKYKIEDLVDAGYAEVDLEKLGFKHKVAILSTSVTPVLGTSSVTATVKIGNDNDTDVKAVLMLNVYDNNGKSAGLKFEEVVIPAGGTITAVCTADVLDRNGVSGMVMLWKDLNDMISLTNYVPFD